MIENGHYFLYYSLIGLLIINRLHTVQFCNILSHSASCNMFSNGLYAYWFIYLFIFIYLLVVVQGDFVIINSMRRFVDDGFVKKIILIFLLVLYILERMYMGRAEETTLGLDHIYIYLLTVYAIFSVQI